MATKKMTSASVAILVTTEHRGIYFGYVDASPVGTGVPESVVLERGRNCVWWDADVHGFLGLAVHGPNKNCKVSPCTPRGEVKGLTGVWECTAEAVKAWESEPWR